MPPPSMLPCPPTAAPPHLAVYADQLVYRYHAAQLDVNEGAARQQQQAQPLALEEKMADGGRGLGNRRLKECVGWGARR